MTHDGKEYYTLQEASDICNVEYMTLYMQLNKFIHLKLDEDKRERVFILKNDIKDYKTMMDIKKKFNERSKK